MPKDLQKVSKSRQILIRHKIAYVQAKSFRLSPNFSAGAPHAPAQLLPPYYEDKFIPPSTCNQMLTFFVKYFLSEESELFHNIRGRCHFVTGGNLAETKREFQT